MKRSTIEQLESILQRYHAWWHCEIIDRAPVWLVVQKDAKPMPAKQHRSLRERWFDIDYQLDCFEANLANVEFLGDAVPVYMPNLGPDICATLFGAHLDFGENTSWAHPTLSSCKEVLGIKPDFHNPYWSTIKQMTVASLERGKGKWLTGITDLHTNGDLLVGLRGPENLCIEIMDDPQSVKRACEYVTDFFAQIYEDLYDPIRAAGQPASTWTPSFYKGKMYVTSCDFICLISPNDFKEIIFPQIVREMRYLDKNIFHLDGPAALRHLNILLQEPLLDGLQWVYGAGNEPAARWIEVYQKAQAAGKCIEVICEGIEDAITVSKHLKPEGVWFVVGGSYTKQQAEDFIRYVERWSAGKC